MVFNKAYDPESVIVNSIVFAPRGVYDCAPLGFTETSRLSTMADDVRPRVYDNELIKDSEYCCPNDSIYLLIHCRKIFLRLTTNATLDDLMRDHPCQKATHPVCIECLYYCNFDRANVLQYPLSFDLNVPNFAVASREAIGMH